jgi:deferrochelatase/peroxidase EfeB
LATVAEEIHGSGIDSRDLTGFIDGTENPGKARAVAALTEKRTGHLRAGYTHPALCP